MYSCRGPESPSSAYHLTLADAVSACDGNDSCGCITFSPESNSGNYILHVGAEIMYTENGSSCYVSFLFDVKTSKLLPYSIRGQMAYINISLQSRSHAIFF